MAGKRTAESLIKEVFGADHESIDAWALEHYSEGERRGFSELIHDQTDKSGAQAAAALQSIRREYEASRPTPGYGSSVELAAASKVGRVDQSKLDATDPEVLRQYGERGW